MSDCKCGNPNIFKSTPEPHKIMGEPVIPLKNIGTNVINHSRGDDHHKEEVTYMTFDSSKFYYHILLELFIIILLILVVCVVLESNN